METVTWYNVTSSELNIAHEEEISRESLTFVPAIGKVVLIVMYATIVVLSVGGNSLVVISVLASEHMRTVTNCFIVNLACSDILMAVLCIPFTFVANVLLHRWPFGPVLCPAVTYGQAVAVFLGAFTLVAISVDRHRAIRRPLRPRLTGRQLAGVVAAIWTVALVLPLPVALVSRVRRKAGSSEMEEELCEEVWPSERLRGVYSVLIMVWQYFLPVFVLTFTYASIGHAIWWKMTPGEPESGRDQRMTASKKKMVKMMVNVVVIYAVCWLPLHTITLAGDAHGEIWSYRYIQVVWIASHWLAMSNCCYNPIVYWRMSSNFRNGFRAALGACLPCVVVRGGAGGSVGRGRKVYYAPPPPPMVRGQAVVTRAGTVEMTTGVTSTNTSR